ncbi:MAG: NAD(P)/FAD-dependent oxidoreductase [Patescibacteria group bacterium]
MNKFDVAVIGGGPAGLMAAGCAAELGARVILLEKNPACGRKLLMTGNGRCNVTQDENNIRELVKKYKNGPFLFSAFSKFGPSDMREFLSRLNIQTKVEELGRVFPASNKANDVLNAMLGYLEQGKVEIKYNANVTGFEEKAGEIAAVKISDGKIEAKKFILCTGGSSYPSTGSDGSAYAWLKALGHTIVEPLPALVPLKISDAWIKELKGLALENAALKLEADKKVISKSQGDMLFTHFGVSGPAVLTVSREAASALKAKQDVRLSIDIFPQKTAQDLDLQIKNLFRENARRTAANALATIMTARLAPKILELSGLYETRQSGQVTKQERERLVACLKNIDLQVSGSMGFDVAMVTSGGVDVKEVDPKTMQSKIIPNLYLAGEVLDIDGPTGGYNLQACWSTGRAAGESVQA